MQVTSMLSAGYLEPMVQGVSKVQGVNQIQEIDEDKQAREQEILSEEQNIKAKLGKSAQVHTVYHYSLGSDGRRYITGASVTMKGSEEDLNRVTGGVTQEDMSNKTQDESQKAENTQNIIKSEADKREASEEDSESKQEEEAQIRELEAVQREVVAHEAAHKAAAGELGGGVSYTYTEGPDGKSYITGGEVPIRLKQGSTPEETLRNMQQVQRAAHAPSDPSGQDMQVAAKAASIAAKARSEIISESTEEDGHATTVAKGTPIFEAVSQEEKQQGEYMDGVSSVIASVKQVQIQSLAPAA